MRLVSNGVGYRGHGEQPFTTEDTEDTEGNLRDAFVEKQTI
jgi:hypothetical protein